MKISKRQLQRIIKEERAKLLYEDLGDVEFDEPAPRNRRDTGLGRGPDSEVYSSLATWAKRSAKYLEDMTLPPQASINMKNDIEDLVIRLGNLANRASQR